MFIFLHELDAGEASLSSNCVKPEVFEAELNAIWAAFTLADCFLGGAIEKLLGVEVIFLFTKVRPGIFQKLPIYFIILI